MDPHLDQSFLSMPFWKRQDSKKVTTNPHSRTNHDFASFFSPPPPPLHEESSSTPVIGNSEKKQDRNPQQLVLPVAAAALLLGAVGVAMTHFPASSSSLPWDAAAMVQNLLSNPQATLQSVVDSVDAMGPWAPVIFGVLYCLAEVLAVPATPLTLSAGYLFGMTQGVTVVLIAATIAASIAFYIGKTFLRSWVEEILEENPKFAKLDRAVGEQGFKLLVLIRLSPLFPFALSNYLYGASAISFQDYFWGTLLGFAPGTAAYVYTGMVGKELLLGDGSQPWYLYAAGFAVLGGLLKLVSDVANGIVEAIEDEEAPSSP